MKEWQRLSTEQVGRFSKYSDIITWCISLRINKANYYIMDWSKTFHFITVTQSQSVIMQNIFKSLADGGYCEKYFWILILFWTLAITWSIRGILLWQIWSFLNTLTYIKIREELKQHFDEKVCFVCGSIWAWHTLFIFSLLSYF